MGKGIDRSTKKSLGGNEWSFEVQSGWVVAKGSSVKISTDPVGGDFVVVLVLGGWEVVVVVALGGW